MKRVVKQLAALVAVATMVGVGPVRAEPVVNENQFVVLINQLRASKGLGPLAPDQQLQSVARAWSQVMAQNGTLAHNPNFQNQVTDWKMIGENVGVGPTVEGLHAAFVASPAHYENLVEPAFDAVGIGIVEVGGTIWVTQNFKQRNTTAAATNAANQALGRSSPKPAPKPAPAPAPKPAPAPEPAPAPKPAPAPAPKPAAAAAAAASAPVPGVVPVDSAAVPVPDAAPSPTDDTRGGGTVAPPKVEGVAFERTGRSSSTRTLTWGLPLAAALAVALVIVRRRRSVDPFRVRV